MNNDETIKNYIISQLQSGIQANDIAAQLRVSGWSDEQINTAFDSARASILPSVPAQQQPVATTPTTQSLEQQQDSSTAQTTQQHVDLPPPMPYGRLKTGWLLFKQTMSIIRGHTELTRYVATMIGITLLVVIVLVAIYFTDLLSDSNILLAPDPSSPDGEYGTTIIGIIVDVFAAYLLSVITFYYVAGLTAHVLSIFRGETSTYKQNMKIARARLPALMVYSLITVTIGYILRYIENRLSWVGWIISKILGLLWTLATTFVISIIVDDNAGAVKSIKGSISLFKTTWKETTLVRIPVMAALYLMYILIGIPFVILLIILTAGAPALAILLIALFLLGFVALLILDALVTNVLNVALYYYAKHGTIPPSFSAEMLSSVLQPKKRKK